ncbi:hypothetical protein AJ79_03780 [Helicocarpus griseus UAMH5409]|uniref:Cytochrome P450 monooxygenase n=1 Tax=Helicocarpus griseus UAMH5409 TaxID=1447875 RepID=A0A2B7XX64_9EURO|nr:hypothetical protein AJ79_03780 [Helicocarpus griseus UAMH5409]
MVSLQELQLKALQNPRETILQLLGALIAVQTASWIITVIYRVTFHPLAKFPGPFLCRISYIYQIYYEAWLNGRMLERLPELHRKYGSVVRINPNEVHLVDPNLYHVIYRQNTLFLKDPYAYKLGAPNSLSMSLDPVKHKRRKELLNPCFSKRRVHLLQHIMYEEMQKVFEKLSAAAESEQAVPIQDAYYCYTGDIISRYLFGKSLKLIEQANFAKETVDQLRSFTSGIWVSIHISLIRVLIMAMPRSMATIFASGWMKIVWFCESLAGESIKEHGSHGTLEKDIGQETIFDRMLNGNVTKGTHRAVGFQDLADEGASLLVAGTETTATTMAYATYYMLLYPEKRQKLLEEIATVERDADGRLSLQKLDMLPYLNGVIKETLRYTNGVPGRLTRVVPRGGLFIPELNDHVPEGCVVGISHNAIHFNPDIFENPYEFRPERWLGDKGKGLDHWFLAFSKGSRDCIGKTLAIAEVQIMIANLFTTFDLELLPGHAEDMEILDRVIVHSRRNLKVRMKSRKIENGAVGDN